MTAFDADAIARLAWLLAVSLNGANLGIHVMSHMSLFPALRHRLDDRAAVATWQALDRYMGRRMPLFGQALLVSGLLAAVLAFRAGDQHGAAWAGVSTLLVLADTVHTVLKHLPVNRTLQSWHAEAPPKDWRHVLERQFRHFQLRAVFVGTSFLAIAAARA
jgi:hypothetical protein